MPGCQRRTSGYAKLNFTMVCRPAPKVIFQDSVPVAWYFTSLKNNQVSWAAGAGFAMHYAWRTLHILDAQSTHIGCKGLHSQGWWLCCCTAHPHAELNNRLLHRVGFTAEHFSSAKRVSLLHFVLLIRAGCAWVMQILRKRQPAIGPVMCEAFMAGRVSAHRAGWAQVWVMARGGEMHKLKWQWQATKAVHGACRERVIVWMWMCI